MFSTNPNILAHGVLPPLSMSISIMATRALWSSSSPRLSTLITMRFFSTTASITKPPSLTSLILPRRRSPLPLSNAITLPQTTRFGGIRCRVNRAGNSAYSPLNSGSSFSDRPPTEMAPLFPGCDYQHWLMVMDMPGGEGATKQQIIDCEEEAVKKIYNVSCERYFGFGCEIDEEASNKLKGLPGVLFVLPDSYVDPEYKDYGDKLQSGSNIALPPPLVASSSSRRDVLVSVGTALVTMTLSPLMVRAQEKSAEKEEDDDKGIISSIKSLFDPNEKTKSGKVLPKAYLKSAREVVKTLRESLNEASDNNAKFRRNADSAKESIREYLGTWSGQHSVVQEESYVMLEKAIRSLANFYSRAGPTTPLSEEVKSEILDYLNTAEQFL